MRTTRTTYSKTQALADPNKLCNPDSKETLAKNVAAAKPQLTAALKDVTARRKAAEEELAKITAEFDDLIYRSRESGILTIPEIMQATDIPRSRVYQIADRIKYREEAASAETGKRDKSAHRKDAE